MNSTLNLANISLPEEAGMLYGWYTENWSGEYGQGQFIF